MCRITAGKAGTGVTSVRRTPLPMDGHCCIFWVREWTRRSTLERNLAGAHIGGYGEFIVDVTEMLAQPTIAADVQKDGIPLSVMCDNSPNLERAPSDLSDFCLYGGLKRRVRLVHVPSISIEALHLDAHYAPGSPAKVSIRTRLYNPTNQSEAINLQIRVEGPTGKEVFTTSFTRSPWTGEIVLADFSIPDPEPWSPSKPNLYHCTVSLNGVGGKCAVRERFEFVTRNSWNTVHSGSMANGYCSGGRTAMRIMQVSPRPCRTT